MSKPNKPGVEDRIAIQDLIAKYCWALDTGDVESFVACFTPDAVIVEEVFEDPDVWQGHAGIRELIEHGHIRTVPLYRTGKLRRVARRDRYCFALALRKLDELKAIVLILAIGKEIAVGIVAGEVRLV